jgi:Escherichia/Staphylococcus phage prohead protease
MSIEKRTYGLQIRAEGNGTDTPLRLTGYAAKYHTKSNDLGGFRETILPGAFKKAVSNNGPNGDDVRMLKNHDPHYVLGRTKSGTLQLRSDVVGLHFECDLPDTQYARDLHTSVSRGDMSGCSFAFKVDPDGDEWTGDEEDNSLQLRKLRSVSLFDVSAVTYPAYEDTQVSARALEMVSARCIKPPAAPTDWDTERKLGLKRLGQIYERDAAAVQRHDDRVAEEIDRKWDRHALEQEIDRLETLLTRRSLSMDEAIETERRLGHLRHALSYRA